MDIQEFLRARLKSDQQQLAQMVGGTLRIHRRGPDGALVDETERHIARVQRLVDELQAQLQSLERQ